MKAIDASDANPVFEREIERLAAGSSYVRGHLARYMHTLKHMPRPEQFASAHPKVLEIGSSFIFPVLLADHFNFPDIEITNFDPTNPALIAKLPMPRDHKRREFCAYNVNLEEQAIPVPDEYYDLVLCFEVIEHMEKDPMHLMCEINRILKPGGMVYVTTPNIVSGRNVLKILHGYAPHFFMKYSKTRSLYRHNIEYAPGQIAQMLTASGFRIRKLWTRDNFEDPIPEILEKISALGYSTSNRGDNLLAIGQKEGPPVDRYPDQIYF